MRDIDLKVISAAENSNKFQITRFWKEKSLEDVVTLGLMARSTLVDMKRQINMYFFMFMIFILIRIKFNIDIYNDELLIIIWKHNKKENRPW